LLRVRHRPDGGVSVVKVARADWQFVMPGMHQGYTLSMSGVGALMKTADEALYKAKGGGRNCVIRSLPMGVPHKIAAE
jgi:hypothetical protein